MRILTVIGSRPQYIKVKPLHDYLRSRKDLELILMDTGQHYSDNMSDIFIDELKLQIDFTLNIENLDCIQFIGSAIQEIAKQVREIRPDIILVLGDTNSALTAAMVANKLKIPVGHIESGIRCGDRNRPEEMNRILIDEVSDIHFTSRKKDGKNVSDPVYIGDLEYALLNYLDNRGLIGEIDYEDWLLMTIHREENTIKERFQSILNSCHHLGRDIIFPIHHRTKKLIDDCHIEIPPNITLKEPLSYFEMIKALSKCGGVISDSGGVIKTIPFFGKKCIIPLESVEWDDVVSCNFAETSFNKNLFDHEPGRNKNMFYNRHCCGIIVESCRGILKSR